MKVILIAVIYGVFLEFVYSFEFSGSCSTKKCIPVTGKSEECLKKDHIQNTIEKRGTDELSCFCVLKEHVDDCNCTVNTVDHFNNNKIYPRLRSLLHKDYFRYFKVNLNHTCQFWTDDSRCSAKYCAVKPCGKNDVPAGLNNQLSNKQSEEDFLEDCDENHGGLGSVNESISDNSYKEFQTWQTHDDTKDRFCKIDDESSEAFQYVDLMLNPERYTGYSGPSAHRIWNSIYQENCFRPNGDYGPYTTSKAMNKNLELNADKKKVLKLIFLADHSRKIAWPLDVNQCFKQDPGKAKDMCIEKRVFYRAISGLHTSINVHLCAYYFYPAKTGLGKDSWGPNINEFVTRFDSTHTKHEGPQRLKNLYFLYLLELRALVKAGPYLEKWNYFTGNKEEDSEVRLAVKQLLEIARSFKSHFNEAALFSGDDAEKLKDEFKAHFWNISRIMDCVGCDKCKLWGKLQVQGLGTALKILFSNEKDAVLPGTNFKLTRSEVVSFFNGFGRLSSSIYELEIFRKLGASLN